jgi:hypothetical protein
MGDFDHVGRPKTILEHVAYLLKLRKRSKKVEKIVIAKGEEPKERQRIINAGERQLRTRQINNIGHSIGAITKDLRIA